MKKILFLLALVFCVKSYAQDTATFTTVDTLNMTETVYIDSAFGSLDTTRMSTKYLLNRVPVNFGPNNFNGLDGNPVDTIKNTFSFDHVFASVYLSQVSGNPHFTNPLVFAHAAGLLFYSNSN